MEFYFYSLAYELKMTVGQLMENMTFLESKRWMVYFKQKATPTESPETPARTDWTDPDSVAQFCNKF